MEDRDPKKFAKQVSKNLRPRRAVSVEIGGGQGHLYIHSIRGRELIFVIELKYVEQ